jgi:outer membrane protein insertion porin family
MAPGKALDDETGLEDLMQSVCRVFARVITEALLAVAPAALGNVALVAEATEASAQTIVVHGNQRVDPATIRSYFVLKPGERLDAYKVDEALKDLYATGLFQDVRITRSGGAIVVTVVENEVINRVAFEGNDRVKDAQLAGTVESKPRGPFSQATVQADVQRILEVYRRIGRFDARVVPKTIALPNGRVDLVFEINESDKTGVSRITFVGNNAYSDGTLRDEMTITETNWLSWLKKTDVYDPDKLNADLELLRTFYFNRGFADFRIVSATADFDRERNAFFITVTVDEGVPYRFGAIDIVSSIPEIDSAALRGLVRASPGSSYSAKDVDKSVEDISLELAKRGYAFAEVKPQGVRNFDDHTVALTLYVDEGSRAYIERINIRGNTRTRDYVIRREFEIAEGDAYNQVLINRAERRLKNLGFFKTVRSSAEQGSAPDRVIVNVDVEDQPTGEFQVAAGYSTSDGIVGEVSVAERNFLGRGQYVRVAAQYGQYMQGFDHSFTEPFLFDRRLAAGFDLWAKQRDETQYSSYESDTYGGALRAGVPITEEFSVQGRYTIYSQDIWVPRYLRDGCYTRRDRDRCRKRQPGEASIAILESQGETLTSMVGYSLIYNTLDNSIDPREGIYAELRQDLAGVGGDVNFLRTTFDGRYYYELFNDFVFMGRAQAGHVAAWGDQDLRVLDGFFKGPELVRGFETSGIGPRDLTRHTGKDPLGASLYAGISGEVQFPLFFLPKEFGLRGAVFADAGTAFDYTGKTQFHGYTPPGRCAKPSKLTGDLCLADDATIRSSVGASVLWASPLGPLRFDFAYALTKEDYDRTQFFRFSGGGRF